MAKDMTKGGIAKTLIAFCIPLILSGLLQQLYSWADGLIVGNVIGEGPLAAIGATGSISGLFISLLSGFSVGVSILAARAYGEGATGSLRPILSTFLLCLTGASLALMAGGLLLAGLLLRAMDTPADILSGAETYLRIILLGIPFLAAYNVLTAVLRGIGDSRTPLYAIVVSSVCNILLDVLFVAAFGWGVAGAAWATVLSQAAMTVFLLLYAQKKTPMLRMTPGTLRVDFPILKQGLSLSLPTALQYGVRSVGSLFLQSVMNSFGTTTVAAITTAYRIDSVVLLPVINLGAGLSTFVAQNSGAGQTDRVGKGLRTGAILTAAVAVAITAMVIPAGGFLMGLFGVSAEAVSIGRSFFGAIALFYPLFGIANSFIGYLQGLGDVRFTSVISILALGLRIALSYLLAERYGNMIIAYAEMASWVLLLAACGIRSWQKGRALTRVSGDPLS